MGTGATRQRTQKNSAFNIAEYQMIWVVDAKYIGDYKVFVRFNDGVEAKLDLENYVKSKKDGTIFAPLKNIENFKTVKYNSDTDTIEWENGADIAPERLYEMTL